MAQFDGRKNNGNTLKITCLKQMNYFSEDNIMVYLSGKNIKEPVTDYYVYCRTYYYVHEKDIMRG